MRMRVAAIVVICIAAASGPRRIVASAPCGALSSLALPHAAVTLSEVVAPGALVMPASGGSAAAFATLPSFCRVAATLTPSSDSEIKIEIWLPDAGWNGKFEAVGNGGWAGSISYAAMADALRRGYATASTDTGHSGGSATFALGHPEKLIDYAFRSEHEMTVSAKAVISAFYGTAPRLSYWTGCSAGGKQGLKEAQKFPDDFDGIVAGAPAANWSGRAAQSIWITRAVHDDEASFVPPSKFNLVHEAVLEACDAIDGVKDGVLEDPTRCHFDPKALQCSGPEASTCLTSPQVEAVRKIYSPVVNPRTKQEIFPPHERGSEPGWSTMAGPRPFAIGLEFFQFAVFQDPAWDPRSFDFDRGFARAQQVADGEINALDPDLRRFFGHGGKLIQYHGWSDPQISPRSSVEYRDAVLARIGAAQLNRGYRLFMVPGMAHCRGGEGTDTFDMLSALENWVEKGRAPDRISASRTATTARTARTRPLCPYPQTAHYTGTGSSDDEHNFTCRAE